MAAFTEESVSQRHELQPVVTHAPWVQRYLATGCPELLRRARVGVDWSHERLAQQVIRVAARHGSRAASIRSLKISFSRYEHGHKVPGMRSRHLLAESLNGAAPFFDSYRTAEGGLVVVDAIGEEFYGATLDVLDLGRAGLYDQQDRSSWPEMRARFAARFLQRGRKQWAEAFADPIDMGYVLPAPTMTRALRVRIEMFGLSVDRHFRW
jgi:hypothetical protein